MGEKKVVENRHTNADLAQMQSLPLSAKIEMTKRRIRAWYDYFDGDVYVSFSGGKDSTVLLTLAREVYSDIPAVFVDTGLEYPEIRQFVKTWDNVEWLKPKTNFKQVIDKYGVPVISKNVAQNVFDVTVQARIMKCNKRETRLWNRVFNPDSDYARKYPGFTSARYDYLLDAPFKVSHLCCNVMKKEPAKQYEKETGRKPILGNMAVESRLRRTQWLEHGCNAFDAKRQKSTPMAFWNNQDVLQYIYKTGINIASVYGDIVPDDETEAVQGQMTLGDFNDSWKEFDPTMPKLKTTGCKRTGCMFCLFGCTAKGYSNFKRMKETHPKQYDYIMRPKEQGGLNYKEIIDWLNEHGNLHIEY